MTYSWTRTGEKAHILKEGSIRNGSMKALCGVEPHDPISATEEEIRKAERNLCNTCEEL